MQERETELAVGAVDEPAGHERRERRPRAGRPRSCSPRSTTANAHSAAERSTRRRQREVRAEPVVAAAVVELDPDPHETLVRMELERRAHLDECGLLAAADAPALVADGVGRPPVDGDDDEAGAHRARLDRAHAYPLGPLDEEVVVGRRVVVGVAAVAAVDEAVGAGHLDAVLGRDGERAVLGIDRRRAGGRWRACPKPAISPVGEAVAVDGVVGAPSEAGHRVDLRRAPRASAPAPGGSGWSRPARRARAAPRGGPRGRSAISSGRRRGRSRRPIRRPRCGAPTRATRRPANSGPRSISRTHRTFWPVTTVEKPSPPTVRTTWAGQAVPSSATKCSGPSPGTRTSITPERSTGRGVDDDGRVRGGVDLRGQPVRRVAGEALADLAGLLVADHHRVDDLVVAAGARRIVGAVEDEVAPRDLEQRVAGSARVSGTARSSGSARRSTARSAAAHAWWTSTRFDATPMSTFARAPERSSPRHTPQPVGGLLGEVLGERRDHEPVVAPGSCWPPRPRARATVAGVGGRCRSSAAASRPAAAPCRARARSRGRARRAASRRPGGRGRWSTSRRDTRRARANRRAPPTRTRWRRPPRDAAPHDRVLESGEAEQLRHLRDVTEHVGEVTDRRRATEIVGAREPHLQIADERLARHHELVHQDHPRSDLQPAAGREPRDRRSGVRTHLEVVVDDGGLPVEEEARVRQVALEHREQLVEELYQPETEGLERRVPLAVPMGVRHDRDDGDRRSGRRGWGGCCLQSVAGVGSRRSDQRGVRGGVGEGRARGVEWLPVSSGRSTPPDHTRQDTTVATIGVLAATRASRTAPPHGLLTAFLDMGVPAQPSAIQR